jgi:ABC-2 type transporter
VFVAAAVSKIDRFSYIQSAVITPLFLVSGTFFPIDALPQGAQIASNVNPLYHCVQLVRHAVVFRLRIGRPGPRGDPALLRAGDVATGGVAIREAPDRLGASARGAAEWPA